MLKIDNKSVDGRFTFSLGKDEEGNLIGAGILITNKKYIEEISSIETDRYLIKGVNVFKETFGSDSPEISYEFTANDFEVKNIDS